jgi:hypothetical protein
MIGPPNGWNIMGVVVIAFNVDGPINDLSPDVSNNGHVIVLNREQNGTIEL